MPNFNGHHNVISNNINFLDDLWYHVAISWGSEIGMQIYIDGILHATNNEFIGTVRNDSWCCLEMGRTSSENLHYFNGNIDNVSIYISITLK